MGRLQLIVFDLNRQRYALPLATVDRVIRAVEVTRLPGAPGGVLGVIDVAGQLMPLLSLRRRLGMPQRDVDPTDQFVIAHTSRRALALLVDAVHGMIDCDGTAVTSLQRVAAGLEQFQGVAQFDDGLVLIHDIEKFLSLDEALTLDAAMEKAG